MGGVALLNLDILIASHWFLFILSVVIDSIFPSL